MFCHFCRLFCFVCAKKIYKKVQNYTFFFIFWYFLKVIATIRWICVALANAFPIPWPVNGFNRLNNEYNNASATGLGDEEGRIIDWLLIICSIAQLLFERCKQQSNRRRSKHFTRTCKWEKTVPTSTHTPKITIFARCDTRNANNNNIYSMYIIKFIGVYRDRSSLLQCTF